MRIDIDKISKDYSEKNILVIGDIILDQYTLCEPIGMSAEAPVLVIKEMESRNFIDFQLSIFLKKVLRSRLNFLQIFLNCSKRLLVKSFSEEVKSS